MKGGFEPTTLESQVEHSTTEPKPLLAEATCNKCAGAHLPSKCTSATYKCPNCDLSNEKYKTKYNVKPRQCNC